MRGRAILLAGWLISGVAVQAHALPSGLVSWWRAEGAASDVTGAHHGTLQGGVTFVPGKFGQAFHLDGVDDHVDLGNWFNLQTFTIAMRVKAGTSQVLHANILDNNHNNFRSWVIQHTNTGSQFVWGTHNGVGDGPDDIFFSLTPGTWQHLVISVDGGFVNRVYLDGALIGTTTSAGPIVYDGTQFMRAGRWGGGGRNFNGDMDELQVYDRALTDAEVAALATEVPVPGITTQGTAVLIGLLSAASIWAIRGARRVSRDARADRGGATT